LNHHACADFWSCYAALPASTRKLADKSFALLKTDPWHPSFHFKKVEHYWSARVGLHHRVLGIGVADGILWFWIGSHADYDALVS
jgi:hypothetical protein